MARLDLRSLVGQLLIMGFDGTEPGPRLRTIAGSMQPGGIILFARNIESPGQTYTLLEDLASRVTVPMFRCVDMEGGLVDRLRNVVAPAPAVADVARTGKAKLYREHGRIIGQECRALGFNTDFAPVFDLGFEASRPVMRTRTASSETKLAIEYAQQFLRGLEDAHVLGCGKHFPGLGEGTLDSHEHLPVITKSWDALWKQDLLPYQKLRKQIPFVMVAHAAYPQVTGDSTPASLSSTWLRDILRKKIGYNGIILSDDLDMSGVLVAGSVGEVAVETLRAGADMFLVCQKEESVWTAYDAVLRTAESDPKFRRRVLEAADRVLKVKRRLPLLKRKMTPPTDRTVARLRESVAKFTASVQRESAKANA